ncbi:Hypothetical protein MSYG_4176 [Malassezia sympodialis ATCC 42132]|uniref:Uncharacterized protein n=1 Tax=Malassezia sympodialis (strain ATCC 42132) TaxID=1230383 RepID=A0A1M8ABH3_MALS4|nr:Hypothetical protein MSYG_4176 [Malassezia sympodialis ATCC 42132]
MSLPWELQWIILQEAARQDPASAYALALVSRNVCECTKAFRWRTIVIQSQKALLSFMETLKWIQVAPHLISIPGRDAATQTRHLYIDTSESEGPDLLTLLAMLPDKTRSQLVDPDTLLSQFPNVCQLSLGSVELQAFSKSIQSISPVSCTLVFDGNETLLSHIFGGTSRHALCPFRRRLRHLHVIGINPQSELTGLPMPLTILEPLCAGSFSAGSCFDARALSSHAAAADRAAPGVRHLRYDTRKFSFRPLDIFATRLRYFFQRPDVPAPSGAAVHALLEDLGLGMMECLEICWRTDQNQNAREKSNVERQKQLLRTSMFTGGWPQELRGAWTDRGIQHKNAQEAFRMELQDAIAELYGWDDTPTHAYLDGVYVDRIRSGFSEREHTAVHRLGQLLVPAYPSGAVDRDDIEVGLQVRRPGTFLHIGERQAALYVPDRVCLFLERAYMDSPL